ncbi:hypothetical protein RI054_13g63720 [Pseudoscourfieldia marina]
MPTTHAEQGDDDANHKRNLAHSLRLRKIVQPRRTPSQPRSYGERYVASLMERGVHAQAEEALLASLRRLDERLSDPDSEKSATRPRISRRQLANGRSSEAVTRPRQSRTSLMRAAACTRMESPATRSNARRLASASAPVTPARSTASPAKVKKSQGSLHDTESPASRSIARRLAFASAPVTPNKPTFTSASAPATPNQPAKARVRLAELIEDVGKPQWTPRSARVKLTDILVGGGASVLEEVAPPAVLVQEFDNMAPQPSVKFDSKSRQSFASDGSQELACTSSSSSDDALVIQFDSDGKDDDDDVASDASSEILAAAAIKTEASIMARDDDQKIITSAQTFTSRAAKPTSKGKLKIALDLAARPKSKRALVKTNQSWFTKWCACRAPQVHEPCENQT